MVGSNEDIDRADTGFVVQHQMAINVPLRSSGSRRRLPPEHRVC